MGQRHPIGLTPDSLYILDISCWSLTLSPPYFFCISCSLGWSDDMALVECSCFNVIGSISSRTMITNTMIAMPKLSKKMFDRMMRKLSMGWSNTMFHKSIMPTVKEMTTRAATMMSRIIFFLPSLGKAPLGICIFGLSVVIHHRRWT